MCWRTKARRAPQGINAGNPADFAVGKNGVGYVLDAARLGGAGGQLTEQPICAAFGSSVHFMTIGHPLA